MVSEDSGGERIVRNTEWAIGIYEGSSPLRVEASGRVMNPVIAPGDATDIETAFVADPFMIRTGVGWFMFFEVLPVHSNDGKISVARSQDGLVWEYDRVVLNQEFHLGYPYVFEWESQFYMVPETRGAGAVKLFEAVEFPTEWVFVKDLIRGNFADPSPFQFEGRWWMFVLRGHEELMLYTSEVLEGPWQEHPKSPLIHGRSATRPAGGPFIHDGKVIRFTQDDIPDHGRGVRAFQVDVLTPDEYEEHEFEESPVLQGSGSGFNEKGMHHIDAHHVGDTWIASVDGVRSTPVETAR
jgi:hypothetical protein